MPSTTTAQAIPAPIASAPTVYRCGPSWGRLRYPFKISEAMLARLTPERRTIIESQPQSLVPPGAAA